MFLKCDHELSFRSISDEIGEVSTIQVFKELSAVREHRTNGFIENGIQGVEDQARMLKPGIKQRADMKVPFSQRIVP